MPVYAATIFLSAFLLFQVQPMIAKFILPWFGGSAAVWSAVLLFFQLLLLAGYFYAHVLIKYAKPKAQFWIHAVLLIAALATLPIIPAPHWKPTGGDDPTWRILLVLGATVGLPYTLLAATSPLLQAWYLRTNSLAIPYRLFALSNFGSMLALLSYPFLVEPYLTLGHQAWTWSGVFGAFALLCAFAAWKSRVDDSPSASAPSAATFADVKRPRPVAYLLWIGLAACASALLLAVTSHLTQNVAPIPLLWIAPLSLYLLSFILCFEGRIYYRPLWLILFIGALGTFAVGNYLYEENYDVVQKLIPALCAALFVTCMVCHGELARSKPHPKYLTEFYLMVSIGGAVGGLFVAILAPNVFNTYLELPVAIAVAAILVAGILTREAAGRRFAWAMQTALAMAVVGLIAYLTRAEVKSNRDYLFSSRNFYGVLRVKDHPPNGDYPGERVLIHGTINHGTQVNLPDGGRIPTSYFGELAGINRALRALHDRRGKLHIGILGLGAGVTATLANAGDTLHYYEINPLVVDIAKRDFKFWQACPAAKTLFMGDGRLSLEKIQASENLDFLAMDAFTSDAVPVHLLTREAYAVYLRHMRQDGVLAINISNRYLDLEPVVAQAASELGFTGAIVPDDGDTETFYTGSTWVLMSRDPAIFDHENFKGVARLVAKPGFRVWTDDFSNIIKILKK